MAAPEIVWDEVKRSSNLRKHGLDFAHVAEQFDFADAVISPTLAGRRGDRRFKAIGWLGERIVTLVFASLGTQGISCISLRPASRKERKAYAES